MTTLAGSEIILGVSGSIAAYKAVHLLRELVRLGTGVTVVMTKNATNFVGPLTFSTLSGRPVMTDLFDPQTGEAVEHVALAEKSHAFVVAPATANVLAKAAHGIADDALTTMLLATRAPVLMAPAMDGGMWSHPAVAANVQILRARGVTVMEPEAGPLASGRSGTGRLPEIEAILEAIHRLLVTKKDLAGERVLITAGPTREPIDPVRYLSNRSSGKMGYALATAALRRGADVVLISGPSALTPPPLAAFVPVQTAEEMREAVLQHLPSATIVVMAAAVADYRPKAPSGVKMRSKQERLAIELVPNPDILKEIAGLRPDAFIVGFAAETHDVLSSARTKLESKKIDLLVVNDVSRSGIGFETDDNQVVLLDRWGGISEPPRMAKLQVADAIYDRLLSLRASAPASAKAPR
jgi:phosphopantothenoylcysteine decarboxylase/phosphopantothenate--cysteine ligase